MNIDLLFDDYSEAYRKIFEIFKQTNKLKKVSYSIGSKRYCYQGRIENGILKVKLKNIYENPRKEK